MWPDNRLRDLLGLEVPIVQAPMAGANGSAMAAAVSAAGGLGSLPCAALDGDKIRAEIGVIRQQSGNLINVNFFTHIPPDPDLAADAVRRDRLRDYYLEHGLDPEAKAPAVNRAPFDAATCEIVEDLKPKIVSFHFGLPETALLERVKASGCKVLSSATTVAEAEWLAARGCDAIIAQGYEAGGNRGIFLNEDVFAQVGTMALVPQVVDGRRRRPGDRGRRHRRRARDRRRLCARRLGRADRHRIPVHAGITDQRPAPGGIAQRARRPDGADQRILRPPGAQHSQPRDAGGRADL